MSAINVDGAAARLLANRTLAKAGYCLYYVWLAISRGVVHYITGGAGSAYATWLAVPADHQHTSRTVPKDFPAFLGKKFTSSAGDVIISRGDGTFVATDWPKSKQVGICTLAQREKQTGRKFVGWASSMGGHVLVSTSLAGESDTLIAASPTPKGSTMRFRVITETGVGVTTDGYTTIEIDPKTDPAEFAAAEVVWGSGENRVYISAENWRIEKIQIAKRLAQLPAATGANGGLSAQDKLDIIAAIKAIPAPPTQFVAK